MGLKFYDTVSRAVKPFRPLDRKNVRLYVCGPTVYDFAHIGNARPVIVFDVLFRLLRHRYGADHVTYVRNITDVDDKINDRAARDFPGLPLNEAIRKVTEQTEKQFHDDVDALSCLRPTVEPRATDHIEEMKVLIERIIENKRAYVLDDHILFRIEKLLSYGKLSHRSLKDMRSSERADVAPKHNPMDFVLWKPSKPGEPSWSSPAGIVAPGRPGWHIECSAMSWKYLGERFDIHGGGVDLLFPHHENERAQSCRAFNRLKMAQVWMHNGFLQVEGEKMSKSIGNFVTIRELLENWFGYAWPGEALRFNMIQTHYRQPIDWTFERLDDSHRTLSIWYSELKGVRPSTKVPDEIIEPLSDDLNCSRAIAGLHLLRKRGYLAELRSGLEFLGFSCDESKIVRVAKGVEVIAPSDGVSISAAELAIISTPLTKSEIESLISDRAAARARKDFKESDRIRDELAAKKILLKDSKDADGNSVTTWEIAR
jgi:cysteinyl-tRNA synthetase